MSPYSTSKLCECCADSWWPAPPGMRMTNGTFASPPNMYRIFAALLTIWSYAISEKLMVIISTTGRRPSIAEPMALPTITSSAIGASTTRFSPKRSSRPSVTRYAPPNLPMSSPMR